MRILVCGGRDFGDIDRELQHHEPDNWRVRKAEKEYEFIIKNLELLAMARSIFYKPDDNWLPSDIEIISGMARGADSVACDWASVNWCMTHCYPADWDKYGKRAGYIRNQQMLDKGKPDLVVAFPGGKGTKMMVDLAKKAGVEVLEYGYPG